jgi:hypothetical protein
MAGQVIPFLARHPQRAPLTRRQRYKLRLYERARAGDVGAEAEVAFAAMRCAARRFVLSLLLGGDGIAAVRKLRRQLAQLKGGA